MPKITMRFDSSGRDCHGGSKKTSSNGELTEYGLMYLVANQTSVKAPEVRILYSPLKINLIF